jgi:hypothetical protein
MAKAGQIARRTPSALQLLDVIDPATPTGVQLLATSADELRAALTVLEEEVRGVCVMSCGEETQRLGSESVRGEHSAAADLSPFRVCRHKRWATACGGSACRVTLWSATGSHWASS